MPKDKNKNGACARSTLSAGYATPYGYDDGQGLIIDATGRAVWDAYELLNAYEAEVRRLRAALDFRGHGGSTYNKLCQAIVALPCCPLAGLIGEAAQELAAHESHNEVAELRPSGKDANV